MHEMRLRQRIKLSEFWKWIINEDAIMRAVAALPSIETLSTSQQLRKEKKHKHTLCFHHYFNSSFPTNGLFLFLLAVIIIVFSVLMQGSSSRQEIEQRSGTKQAFFHVSAKPLDLQSIPYRLVLGGPNPLHNGLDFTSTRTFTWLWLMIYRYTLAH